MIKLYHLKLDKNANFVWDVLALMYFRVQYHVFLACM